MMMLFKNETMKLLKKNWQQDIWFYKESKMSYYNPSKDGYICKFCELF